MKVVIGGFERGVQASSYPAVMVAVRYLKDNGYDVIDPIKRDEAKMWDETTPSTAYRNCALMWDVAALQEASELFLMPGWEGVPEGAAMAAMAMAMNKRVSMLQEHVFSHQTEVVY